MSQAMISPFIPTVDFPNDNVAFALKEKFSGFFFTLTKWMSLRHGLNCF